MSGAEDRGPAGATPSTLAPPYNSIRTLDGPGDGFAGFMDAAVVPGYRLLGELGRGGMGVVYQAFHVRLERTVALKVILGGGRSLPTRMLSEARTVAAINHPNVVQIYDFGEINGQPYMVMEFCPRGTLAAQIDRATRVAPDRTARLIRQIARGVAAGHARGIVHRDLKPGNVLFDEAGEPKVADFGLARRVEDEDGITRSGAILGTPGYMAPEQASGNSRQVGPPADVWSLGVTLYECLTGRRPFTGDNVEAVLAHLLFTDPVRPRHLRPDIPADLERICLKCLDKHPDGRYPDAAALAEDLDRLLRGEPVSARPVPAWRRWLRRWRRG